MEQVFVVRRQDCFAGSWPQGYLPLAADAAQKILCDFVRLGLFVPRDEAEANPAWKQTIPYCVIRQPGRVFCVQRKAAQSETRLHNRLSIGLGGHANPASEPLDALFFRRVLDKELSEELFWEPLTAPEPRFIGLLNDDATEVGKVHIGLVFVVDLPKLGPAAPLLRVREVNKMVGGFRPLVELRTLWQDPLRFESWSRVLLEGGIAGDMAIPTNSRARAPRPQTPHPKQG